MSSPLSDRPGSGPGTAAPGERVRILALATSGDWCSVALHRHEAGVDESECLSERLGSGQSERVLAMIRELCASASLPLGELDAIAFDAGPGSFTGLRVACAVAQGLGFALGRPLLPVDSLAVLAWQRLRASGRAAGDVLVATDARMEEVYVGLYRLRLDDEAQSISALVEPRLVARAGLLPGLAALWPTDGDAAPQPAQVLPGGNAWRALGLIDEWAAHHGLAPAPIAPGADEAFVRADALAEIALRHWRAGMAIDAAEAAPRYVRDKVALDRAEQRALRARRAERADA